MGLYDSLISYWSLDEASNNALDAHGSNNLTDINTVGSATGKVANARDFENTNAEYFTITDNASLSTGDIDFTFCAWVNLEEKPASSRSILGKTRTGLSGIEYALDWLNTSDRFRWRVGSGSVLANNLGAPSTGTWYFIVAWHDAAANTINIQVNNGTVNSAAHASGTSDTTYPFELGRNNFNTNNFDGLLDEVGFWKRVLTSDERSFLYNSGAGRSYDDLGLFEPTITTSSLPNGVRGVEYDWTGLLAATGGTGSLTWTVVSGSLPTGFGTLPTNATGSSGTPTAAGTFNFTVRATDSIGLYDEQALSITIVEPPTSKWKTGGFVPQQDMSLWIDALVAPSGGSAPDLSGNGHDLSEATNPPTLVPDARNGNPWFYFDGTNDKLSGGSSSIVAKHIFVVCALDRAAFAGSECVFQGSQPVTILRGNGASSTIFADSGFITSYKKNGVSYALNDMQAPINNELSIIELVMDDGFQIDDTFLMGVYDEGGPDYWKGPIAEVMMYSVELADYLRGFIYDYLAMKWFLWQQNSAGRYVFPFIADRVRSLETDVEHYLSEPYEGDLKALVRGDFSDAYSLPFGLRNRYEYLAAEAFFKEHRPLTPFIFRDCRFDPPRDRDVRFSSPLREQGSGVSHKCNYSFEVVEVEPAEEAEESSSSSSSSSS